MTWHHLNYEECEAAAKELAMKLESSGDMHFIARDLGFDDHTAIGAAVRPILAKWIGRTLVNWRQETEETARGIVERRSLLNQEKEGR